MLTQNFYNLMKEFTGGGGGTVINYSGTTKTLTVGTPASSTSTNYINVNGYNMFNGIQIYRNNNSKYVSNVGYVALDIGTGDRAESLSDYTLEATAMASFTGLITSNLSAYIENGVVKGRTFNYLYQNTSGAEVTIKEVGLYTSYPTTGAGANTDTFLIDRTVLASPITVPAGATLSFSVNVKMY